MGQEMDYDSRVKGLEEVLSYGSLGLLNTIAIRSDDHPNIKKNIVMINGSTIVRNCYDKSRTDIQIVEAIRQDVDYLRAFLDQYAQAPLTVIMYFHYGIHSFIPEIARRPTTDSRSAIERISLLLIKADALNPNVPNVLLKEGHITWYGLSVAGTFAYRALDRSISSLRIATPRIWMMTHCPIDYLITDTHPNTDIVLSHTGKVIRKRDIGTKLFKDERIPFNRVMYKLFGDKDYVKPVCRNRPKAMKLLEDVNLKLRTETEITKLAKERLGVDIKDLKWDL